MSAADLAAVLLVRHLRYDFDDRKNPANDRLIFAKGHASPLLYAALKAAGVIDDEELLTYRAFGSRLEGHPTPALPCVDVAAGSLETRTADRRRHGTCRKASRPAAIRRARPRACRGVVLRR
jgi:transketolase